MAEEKAGKISLEIDAELAFRLDEILRGGLARSGLIPEREARSIRPVEATLQVEPETAARLSQMLREGLVNAAAAHQANNRSVASAVGRVVSGEHRAQEK